MRRPVDAERVRRFLAALGKEADRDVRLYLTGGATAVLQRGHAKDHLDVQEMIARGLVERAELWRRFEQIEPQLYRYPAIDPAAFRRALEEVLSSGI